jgi:hypothetical protein
MHALCGTATHSDAEVEMIEAAACYEAQQSDLGRRFLAAVCPASLPLLMGHGFLTKTSGGANNRLVGIFAPLKTHSLSARANETDNPILRGWHNYHQAVDPHPRRILLLNRYVRDRLRIFLKRKCNDDTRGSRRTDDA